MLRTPGLPDIHAIGSHDTLIVFYFINILKVSKLLCKLDARDLTIVEMLLKKSGGHTKTLKKLKDLKVNSIDFSTETVFFIIRPLFRGDRGSARSVAGRGVHVIIRPLFRGDRGSARSVAGRGVHAIIRPLFRGDRGSARSVAGGGVHGARSWQTTIWRSHTSRCGHLSEQGEPKAPFLSH